MKDFRPGAFYIKLDQEIHEHEYRKVALCIFVAIPTTEHNQDFNSLF